MTKGTSANDKRDVGQSPKGRRPITKGTPANHKRDVGQSQKRVDQPLQHEQKQVIVGLDPTISQPTKKRFIIGKVKIRRSSRRMTKRDVGQSQASTSPTKPSVLYTARDLMFLEPIDDECRGFRDPFMPRLGVHFE
jgi:hypothetical protein